MDFHGRRVPGPGFALSDTAQNGPELRAPRAPAGAVTMSRRIAFAIVAFLASTSVASAQQLQQLMVGPSEPAITTHGKASVKRAPDRAWITVSTEVRDAKPAEARQKSADTMTA